MKPPEFLCDWLNFVALSEYFKDTNIDEIGTKEVFRYSTAPALWAEIVRNDMAHYSFRKVVIELFIKVLNHVA